MPVIYPIFFFLLVGCQQFSQKTDFVRTDMTQNPGWASVFQTYTSDSETTLNVLRPRLADVSYIIEEDRGDIANFVYNPKKQIKVQSTTTGPHIHWKVDRLHIRNLKPGIPYRLVVVNKRWKMVVDWRRFKTLDIKKSSSRFVVGSCMSDSHAFEHIRSRIWDRIPALNPDFIMLLGDQVYVDDFDFVERQKASEFDIWTRYIDSFRKIPLFQKTDLIPILAVWDDHDYGTNNSDRYFLGRLAAEKVFNAFFGGEPIAGVIDHQKSGVHFSFTGFGQRHILMDNRYFREPDPNNPYGHWGEKQHKWFQEQLRGAKTPVFLANGGQFFTKATLVQEKKGKAKQINESFIDDHPKHFRGLIQDIKASPQPVVFLSGDIHYSEIANIEKNFLGYETYEITSSPLHSFIYRAPDGQESWLDNPRRIVSIKEHNFLLVNSRPQENSIDLDVKSYGVKQDKPYFEKTLRVKR